MGNHGDLFELAGVHPQQVSDLGGDLGRTGDHLAAGEEQVGVRSLGSEAFPRFFRALVAGVANHPVLLALVGEGQLGKGFFPWRGKITAQPLHCAGGAAHLPKEGEGDTVKYGGFPRAGVPGDEEQPPFPKVGKGDFHPAGIGAKGIQHQFYRFHRASSNPANSWERSAVCSSSNGAPFCAS